MQRSPETARAVISCALLEAANQYIRPDLEGMVDAPVSFRIGTGKATNHRSSQRGARHHRITIGVLCIQDHISGPVHEWRHVREIREQGLNRGDTVAGLLCHVLLHEAAHAVQVARGGRTHRSVHNDAFYTALRELNAHPMAEKVHHHLAPVLAELGDQVLALHDPARKPACAIATTPSTTTAFAHGDWVRFTGRDGTAIVGQVVRLNARTVSVATAVGSYRVPYQMLHPASGRHPPPQTIQRSFKVGQRVSFNHRGRHIHGVIDRVNTMTVRVKETERRSFRVPFGWLTEKQPPYPSPLARKK